TNDAPADDARSRDDGRGPAAGGARESTLLATLPGHADGEPTSAAAMASDVADEIKPDNGEVQVEIPLHGSGAAEKPLDGDSSADPQTRAPAPRSPRQYRPLARAPVAPRPSTDRHAAPEPRERILRIDVRAQPQYGGFWLVSLLPRRAPALPEEVALNQN